MLEKESSNLFVPGRDIGLSIAGLLFSQTGVNHNDITGLDQVKVKHKPRLLSDNGPSYISAELANYLKINGMTHTRDKP